MVATPTEPTAAPEASLPPRSVEGTSPAMPTVGLDGVLTPTVPTGAAGVLGVLTPTVPAGAAGGGGAAMGSVVTAAGPFVGAVAWPEAGAPTAAAAGAEGVASMPATEPGAPALGEAAPGVP